MILMITMRKNLVLSLLTCAVLAQCGLHANAQTQDPTIQYLINAPITLMDKGVFEIQRKIERANLLPYWISNRPESLRNIALLSSVYVYSDRIAIHVYVYPEWIDGAGEVCIDLHKYAQKILGFQPNELGRPAYMSESLAEIFGHYSYAPTAHPENLGSRLLGIVSLQAAVIPNSGNKAFCHSIGGGPITSGQIPV